MLITRKGYVALYWLCSFVLSIYGAFVFFVQIRQDTYNGQLPLMLYVAAKDLLTSFMAIPLLIIHFVYLQNYPMQRSIISRQFLCKLHGFLTIYTELIAKEVAIVMGILHYRIIVNAMTKRPYTICRITQFIGAMCCFDFSLSLLWTYFSDTESSFLCSPYSLHTKVYSQTINIGSARPRYEGQLNPMAEPIPHEVRPLVRTHVYHPYHAADRQAETDS